MSDPDRRSHGPPGAARGRLPRHAHDLLRIVARAFPDGSPQGHVLCAVSGGSDSLALLELLTLARGSYALTVSAAYVDHSMRAAAHGERDHVRRFAGERAVRFHAAAIEDPASGDEAHLRARRYEHLERIADDIGADWIATGHTRDDQIETILFRLLRGSGRLGLSGIPARRGRLVRPLLEVGRGELQRFLRARDLEWVEDASNEDPRYTRNRIRHEILPLIESCLGTAGLARLPDRAARWREEDLYLESQAGRWSAWAVRDSPDHGSCVDLVALDDAPSALRVRVLRRWLSDVTGGREVSLARLEAVERLCASRDGTARADVGGVTLVSEQGRLYALGGARQQR